MRERRDTLSETPTPGAAIVGAIDYKKTFAQRYETEDERFGAYSECHTRSAKRVLKALLANGGTTITPSR